MRQGLAALLVWLGGPAWAACGDALPATGLLVAEADGLQLVFAARPSPLPLGQHFALDIVLCPLAKQPLPATLAVDADMPAHRHGMNYRASVSALGEGRFRAEGLMFHMAGRWRFIFDVPGAAGQPPIRLTREVDLR